MIRKQVIDPLFSQCPVRNVLSRIGDRWSLDNMDAIIRHREKYEL